jgi:hypothetical protein
MNGAFNSLLKQAACTALMLMCACAAVAKAGQNTSSDNLNHPNYPGIPQSAIYAVAISDSSGNRRLPVFESSCPAFRPGYMNMMPKDQYPLKLFHNRSISWVNFSFSGSITIQVRMLSRQKVHITKPVKIFPSAANVIPRVDRNVITFTLTRPGQYSVELGAGGFKNGLLIFANPLENDPPEPTSGNYLLLTNETPSKIASVPASYSGLYFRAGIHDIGVYHVPIQVKNIYFEPGAWVYGALIMDGNSGVKIFGRGVLSGAKLNYRQSHMVEALHGSRIDLEGIVIADTKYFAVRLLGTNNIVQWVKIVGGWTYNTDGIAAFAGSRIAYCFIWANDDSLKPYRDNLMISDCVVWQLNNGAVVQLGWGNARAANVTISNVDVMHAEWNNNAANRGIVSCIGDKFAKGGMIGSDRSFLIENVVTETPVPFIFNIRPNPASPDRIHGMTFKNWNINTDMGRGYPNYIECADPNNKFDGFVFDDFSLNGTKLTESNWIQAGNFVVTNLNAPTFISN